MKLLETATLSPMERQQRRTLRLFSAALVVILLGLAALRLEALSQVSDRFATFVTLFLGIFIEAVPFLLAGSLVSGAIEVLVDKAALARFIPRRVIPAAFAGSLLGMAFPVCECGVVPVTRRLYSKGLPLPVGIAFLLSAPVVNPVVVASTFAAFGWGPILWGRLGFSILIPFVIGLLFSFAAPGAVLLPESTTAAEAPAAPAGEQQTRMERLLGALGVAGDDFLDMSRYLIAGSMLAAGMQTLVPQATLLALGENTLTAVITLMILAFVLSVCSTVDAFLALSFINSFPPAAILAFLVFGPMVDIKSALMFLGVFRRRVVGYLILLPLLFTLVVTLFLHLQVGLSW